MFNGKNMAKGDWWLKLDIHKWLNDPKNRRLSRANRDSWLTACLMMTLEGDYQISGTRDEIANLLHLTQDELVAFLSDLCRTNVADVTQTADFVTVVSRRYKKAFNTKELGRLRKQKERSHAKVTPESRDRVISNKKEVRKEEIREASATPIAPAEKPSDPRKNHPAIVAIHEAAGIYPPKEIWDDIIDQLGVDIDQVKLKRCFVKWRARGYNKTNYEGVIDWYLNGIPEAGKSNGTINRNQQPRRDTTADRLAATADIISQYPSEAELRGQR